MRLSDIRMQHHRQNCQTSNPYEKLYKSFNFKSGQFCTRNQAESIARHLGFLHNTFGLVIKDFIDIIKYRFPMEEKDSNEAMVEQRQQKSGKQDVFEKMTQNIKWRQQYVIQEQKFITKKKQQNDVLLIESNNKLLDNKNGVIISKKQQRLDLNESNAFNPSLFEYKPQKILSSPSQDQINQSPVVTQIKTIRKNNVINLDDSEDS